MIPRRLARIDHVQESGHTGRRRRSSAASGQQVGLALLGLVVQKFLPGLGDRILLGMDDSPTARYGRHVEGAGVDRNPTPGPADGEWLYGHNGGALAWLMTHPLWGVIAMPLRSLLYVREVDVPKLAGALQKRREIQ